MNNSTGIPGIFELSDAHGTESATGAARQTAVIVDAYTTGNLLPSSFNALGVNVVHVQSSAELIPRIQPPNFSSFRANYILNGPESFESLCAELMLLNPIAVLAGQEPGVPLADRISERLGLATNGSDSSVSRRNKYEMIERLRAAGVPCVQQHKATAAKDAREWADSRGVFPVVVKPVQSASSDHVTICRDGREVEEAADGILDADDLFGSRNDDVIVQGYLHGPEYIVDTVSISGSHYLSGVWRYEKTVDRGRPLYDRDILIDGRASVVSELYNYIELVLSALNIENGPAHAEVIITDTGPILVEIGARLNGNLNPELQNSCLGFNQADLAALAYVHPDLFKQHLGGGCYRFIQPATVHNTVNSQEGVIAAINKEVVSEIAGLASVKAMTVKLKVGDRLTPTVDLVTSPLKIFMTAKSSKQIDLDYKIIQGLKDRVFSTIPQNSEMETKA